MSQKMLGQAGIFFRFISPTPNEIKVKKIILLTLVVTGISLSASAQKDTSNACSKIEESYNEFDNIKSFSTAYIIDDKTPYSGIRIYGVSYVKNIQQRRTTYYLSLETSTPSPDATEDGVVILLENNVKIRKPRAPVKTDVGRDGDFKVSSFITLSLTDLALLKKSPIKSFELYVDRGIVERPQEVYNMFLCLLSKK